MVVPWGNLNLASFWEHGYSPGNNLNLFLPWELFFIHFVCEWKKKFKKRLEPKTFGV